MFVLPVRSSMRRDNDVKYKVTYSNGRGQGSLTTANFDEFVRAIIESARSGCIIAWEHIDSKGKRIEENNER